MAIPPFFEMISKIVVGIAQHRDRIRSTVLLIELLLPLLLADLVRIESVGKTASKSVKHKARPDTYKTNKFPKVLKAIASFLSRKRPRFRPGSDSDSDVVDSTIYKIAL